MTKTSPLAVLALAVAVAAGCDSSQDEAERTAPDRAERTAPAPRPAPRDQTAREKEKAIVGWVTAVAKRDYELAASYFAPDAIVDQGRPVRLPGPAAARAFNASLPCAADLVRFRDEPGPRALGSFRLRTGPGGPCAGVVQVRFTFRDGRFTVWRQLPPADEPPADEPPAGPVV